MPDNEAQRIYHALFNRTIPPVIAQRFAQASERLEAAVPPAERAAYHRALATGADLEALELAARYTRRLPLLSRKLSLMVYLAETLPENQSLLINERSNTVRAFAAVGVSVVRTAWQMGKGLWLLRQVHRA